MRDAWHHRACWLRVVWGSPVRITRGMRVGGGRSCTCRARRERPRTMLVGHASPRDADRPRSPFRTAAPTRAGSRLAETARSARAADEGGRREIRPVASGSQRQGPAKKSTRLTHSRKADGCAGWQSYRARECRAAASAKARLTVPAADLDHSDLKGSAARSLRVSLLSIPQEMKQRTISALPQSSRGLAPPPSGQESIPHRQGRHRPGRGGDRRSSGKPPRRFAMVGEASVLSKRAPLADGRQRQSRHQQAGQHAAEQHVAASHGRSRPATAFGRTNGLVKGRRRHKTPGRYPRRDRAPGQRRGFVDGREAAWQSGDRAKEETPS